LKEIVILSQTQYIFLIFTCSCKIRNECIDFSLNFIGFRRICRESKTKNDLFFHIQFSIKLSFFAQKRLTLYSISRSRRNILSPCTHRCSNTELYSWAA